MDKPESEIEFVDAFNGDTALLLRCTAVLLNLDAMGVLVPHGIGNDARVLLGALASRLARRGAEMQWRPEPQIPDGYDFTISRDRDKWLIALWTMGKPGGGIHRHGYGPTAEEALKDALKGMPLPPPPAGETE